MNSSTDVRLGLISPVHKQLISAFNSAQFSVYVLEGGSRSSKTWSIIQFWILWAYAMRGVPGTRVAVCRLKGTWLNLSVMKDFLDVLKALGIYQDRNHNKTQKIYNLFGVEFWFIGLDDPQKIHGMKTTAFWINEAIEATLDDYQQLMQRCEGFAILDYNPSEEEHWIYDSVLKRPDTWYNHSTMLDNRMNHSNVRNQIRGYEPTPENYALGTADKRKWMIYGLGKRAKLEGLVFDSDKWQIVSTTLWDKKMKEFDERRLLKKFQALDFGYTNDPTACEDVDWHRDGNALWVKEQFYQTRMLSGDIIQALKLCNFNKKIWSESADPRLIKEIKNAKFDIEAVNKYHPKGSILGGIEKMQGMNIFIWEGSFNVIKEFKNYTFQEDKKNTGKFLNIPVDNFNHAIDGIRYVTLMEVLGQKKPQDLRKLLSGFQ